MLKHTLRCLRPPQLADRIPANFETLRTPQSNAARQAAPGSPTLITPSMLEEFTPNKKILDFADKENITFPTALRLVPGQKFADFPIRFSICRRHVFSHYHLKYLSLFEHPLTEKTLHFYSQQKQSRPLWCYVQGSSTTDGSKVVVRAASERMVRAALCRALNAAGYDASGKSLDGNHKPLQGTIRISVYQPKNILKVEFERLVAYMSKLVADVVPRLGGPPRPSK